LTVRAKPAKHKSSASKSARKKPAKPTPVANTELEIGRGLLAQALETPDDDAPRLVYADWLEEQGHPFADVIRIQCKAHRISGDAQKAELKRANALIGRHRKTWLDPIEKWFDAPAFERGMLRRYYGKTGEYARRATQELLLGPASTFGIHETTLRGPCKKIGVAATLAWTTQLWWWDCQLDDAMLAELAGSPHLARLSSLTLEKVACHNDGLLALAWSKHLPRLRHLGLPAPVWLGKFDARALVELVAKLGLTSLTLTGANALDLDDLVADPSVRTLERLSVATKHVRAIVSSPHLTSLATLRISSIDHVDDADVAPLLDNPAFGALETVNLKLWAMGPYRKPTAPMVERIRKRFGGGLTYETSGLPSII
jgi:uncharacterized protein (TIGR02996 family)